MDQSMQVRKSTMKTGRQYRHLALNREAINQEARTVELAFSSEEPYARYFGIEILDHSKGAADLSRLNNAHPLLLEHDTCQQIGVIESATIGADRVGRAVVRFGKSELAQEIFQDVMDGIRKHVSVGYIVRAMVLQSEKDGQETFLVTDWEPLEVSLVAIPADPTVGVGRSAGEQEQQIETEVTKPEAPTPTETTQTEIIEMSITEQAAAVEAARTAAVADSAKRINEILTLGEQYKSHGGIEIASAVIRAGGSANDVLKGVMDKITTAHSDARNDVIDLTPAEGKRYSLSRAVMASITGDWKAAGFEREVSQGIAKRMGSDPSGFFMPLSVLQRNVGEQMKRDFTVATAGEAGNLVQTTVMMDEMVDVLRAKLVFGQLGATALYGLTSSIAIPRKTTAGATQNVTEVQALTEGQPATTLMTLSPKRVGGFVEPSKQAVQQVNAGVDAMLQKDLMDSLAVQIENLGFNGSGTSPAPRGIIATAGIGAVVGGTNGAQFNWGHIVGLESACANANAEPDVRAGYAVNTRTRGWLKQTQKATNLPFIWDNGPTPLNSYRAGVTNNLPNTGTKGTSSGVTSTAVFASDWSDFILAYFGGLDVVVDPYSLATTGQLRITANQFFDCLVRQPGSFAAMTDGLTV